MRQIVDLNCTYFKFGVRIYVELSLLKNSSLDVTVTKKCQIVVGWFWGFLYSLSTRVYNAIRESLDIYGDTRGVGFLVIVQEHFCVLLSYSAQLYFTMLTRGQRPLELCITIYQYGSAERFLT